MENSKKLPMTPHLQIYKWQINMVMSILHRATGIALYFFLIFFSWLFGLNVIWPDCTLLHSINLIMQSLVGKVFISACGFCLYYHLLNGVRHIMWDVGQGFEIQTIKITGVIIFLCSLALTLITSFTLLF